MGAFYDMDYEALEKPDRSLPSRKDKEATRLEKAGSIDYAMHDFGRALKSYKEDLRIRKEAETQQGRAIHKGAPLHMIGLIKLLKGDSNAGTKYLLLAYVEDTLCTDFGEEDEADLGTAARMLRDTFRLKQCILREVKSISRQRKQASWAAQKNPESILNQAFRNLNFDESNLRQYWQQDVAIREKTELSFPQPRELRVFVGGRYLKSDEDIKLIKRIVVTLGYVPILAREVETPRKRTHEYAAILLHTCKYAIFEITEPGGQYMEIERATDYDAEMLVVHRPGAQVSSMVRTLNKVRVCKYSTGSHLRKAIKEFLPMIG